ncbi:unnamed protein product [Chironomus riparius]|uniref:Uncharacterized protein n=1 Tax=Chironomus riparius TaxID=315576 RepID=A0A9N9RPT8_9DIPT|nr:unnamed protein product [Chironomus riparius]
MHLSHLYYSCLYIYISSLFFSRTNLPRLYVKETDITNESESDLTVLQSRSKIQTCKVYKHEAYCHCLRFCSSNCCCDITTTTGLCINRKEHT